MQRAGRPKFLILNGLAGLVLMAQLVLTAGHFHELRARHLDAPRIADATSPSHGAPADDHGHAACPLCWIQAAGANLLLPDPPALPHFYAGAALLFIPAEPQHSAPTRAASFRPRAPPAPVTPFVL